MTGNNRHNNNINAFNKVILSTLPFIPSHQGRGGSRIASHQGRGILRKHHACKGVGIYEFPLHLLGRNFKVPSPLVGEG